MSDIEHLLHTLRSQGRFCGASGSSMYDELFELVAADVEAGGVFATILSGQRRRSVAPSGAAAAARRSAPDGARRPGTAHCAAGIPAPAAPGTREAAWPEIVRIAADHTDVLRAALGQPPQTNEVGRSAALIGGLLRINRGFDLPIRLFEIGSSAGLNLRADHYRYRYAGGQWGPADSPVTIDDAWHGELPPRGCGADRRAARIRHRAHRRHRRPTGK